jgi:phosphotriesterase-related protein
MRSVAHDHQPRRLHDGRSQIGGRRPDYDYARTILELGFCITVDSFGWEHYNPLLGWTPIHDWERMAIVRQLVSEGYGERVMLGTDSVLKHLQYSHGGTGYRHLLANVAPGLRRMGVASEAIDDLLVRNPARLLARVGA